MADDFRVEMIGHATLRVRSGGKTLLTDPWMIDPIAGNSSFHFPPLVHDAHQVAAQTDAIYISHVHPDHLHAPTLALFDKNIPIYIGEYRRKGFRDALQALGFRVIEVPFQQRVGVAGSDLCIAILEHDHAESAAYDSAAVIQAPGFTVFENNDCQLRADKYAWVRDSFDVDYAFLGYSPASFFPICFELEPTQKAELLRQSFEVRYRAFVAAASILQPRLTVPFASGLRFLTKDALWKNVAFSSAPEAIRRLTQAGLVGTVMGPGDRILEDGSVKQRQVILEGEAELTAITSHARSLESWIEALPKPQPCRADVVDRFRSYLLDRFHATKHLLPELRQHVIAYVLTGSPTQRFFFDFSRPDDRIFSWGEPPSYDMRYTYPAGALQQKLDGEIDWDELNFASASVHQVRYARDFYRLLRSETLDLGEHT